MIDAQTGFNAAMGLIAFLGAWVLNRLSADIKALQVADADLVKAVQHIELLVAGSYVKRDDLDKLTVALSLQSWTRSRESSMERQTNDVFDRMDALARKLAQ